MVVRQDLVELLQQDAAAHQTTMTDQLTEILAEHYADRMLGHEL